MDIGTERRVGIHDSRASYRVNFIFASQWLMKCFSQTSQLTNSLTRPNKYVVQSTFPRQTNECAAQRSLV